MSVSCFRLSVPFFCVISSAKSKTSAALCSPAGHHPMSRQNHPYTRDLPLPVRSCRNSPEEAIFCHVIVVLVVLAGGPAGALSARIYAVLLEFRAGRRINRVAAAAPDLLRTGSRRCNLKLVFEMRFFDEIFHYEFSHRRSANVAVANKKDTNHIGFPSSKGTICPVLPIFTGSIFEHILAKNRGEIANRGKMRQIADVIRSKIVVEIGVFYYRLPFVTLGDLGCTARCFHPIILPFFCH